MERDGRLLNNLRILYLIYQEAGEIILRSKNMCKQEGGAIIP